MINNTLSKSELLTLPIALEGCDKPVFAAGGELKNIFCLTKGNQVFMGPMIGDLNNFENYQHYQETIQDFKNLLDIEPEIIACDMHNDYLSTRYAVAIGNSLPVVKVQHHHAHIASCMAEHNLKQNVIGVAFDGTGYGSDGNTWGGEFFVGGYKKFERTYHLRYIPSPGGDKAAQEPWRMAISYIYQSLGKGGIKFTSRWENNELIISMIEKKINSPLTSSVGRLFDAVSSIIGLCDIHLYEADAAIKLEKMCGDKKEKEIYSYQIEGKIIDTSRMIRQILLGKKEPHKIAIKFHNTIANIILEVSLRLREEYKINRVILSGGVFQNKVLREKTQILLEENDFDVFTHAMVPTHDGGISLGQAAIAKNQEQCA